MSERATGRDDPALAETSWPMPDAEVEWQLRYGPTPNLAAAEILAAYRALIVDGVGGQQTKRLKALRRVWKARQKP